MRSNIFNIVLLITALVCFGLVGSARADCTEGPPTIDEDSLLVRYAFLVGGRDGLDEPETAGLMSREELTQYLLDWDPAKDSAEVKQVLALQGLGEVARQATQLPADGGQTSGIFQYGGSTFEIRLHLRAQDDGSALAAAEIFRNGEILSAPGVRLAFGERSIVSTKNGPEAPFLFFVIEVDRLAAGTKVSDIHLKSHWRKGLMRVDGEEVLAPKAINKVSPPYTKVAKEELIQGVVIVELLISKEGRVEDVSVLKGLPKGLTEQAVQAARQWTFEPATYRGEPVEVLYNLTFNFQLK